MVETGNNLCPKSILTIKSNYPTTGIGHGNLNGKIDLLFPKTPNDILNNIPPFSVSDRFPTIPDVDKDKYRS